jgi:hypothetical protein
MGTGAQKIVESPKDRPKTGRKKTAPAMGIAGAVFCFRIVGHFVEK